MNKRDDDGFSDDSEDEKERAMTADLLLAMSALVLPWSVVAPKIEKIVARSVTSIKAEEEDEDDPSFSGTNSVNVNIPNGFQLLRNTGNSRTALKSIVYMPGTDGETFGCLDANFVYIWKPNQQKNLKINISQNRGSNANSTSILLGLDLWIYIKQWKLIVFSTAFLELKIVDTSFKLLSSLKLPKPVLCLEFVDGAMPQLCTGGVGIIIVYKFKNVFSHSRTSGLIEFDSPRLVIEDLNNEEWVSNIAVDPKRNLLYASYERNVNVYDFTTGARIYKFKDIHLESITCILVWDELGYWLTGSKDATVKIWNTQNCLLYELKEHYQTITGMCLAKIGNDSKFTFLLTSSKDCTVRMWNLEDGSCMNRLSTMEEINGIKWMKDNQFCTFANDGVSVWSLNRFFCIFSALGSPVIKLSRVAISSIPNRLFAYGTDGSVLLISPRTGQKLIVGFPFVTDSIVIDGLYDPVQGKVYLLCDSGNFVVYSSTFSPCMLSEDWTLNPFQEKVKCIAGLPVHKTKVAKIINNGLPLHYFMIIGGTDSGQLVSKDVQDLGYQSFITQAHGGPITGIYIDRPGELLITSSADSSIKLWDIVYYKATQGVKYLKNAKSVSGNNLALSFNIKRVISFGNSIPDCFKYHPESKYIGSGLRSRPIRIFAPNLANEEYSEIKRHPIDEDHGAGCTAMAIHEKLSLLITCGMDGFVKVWCLMTNKLIREIQFNEKIFSIEVVNDRGDIVLALANEIVLVQVQDYLPPEYLEKLLYLHWEDDPIEDPEKFDLSSNWWKKNKKKQKRLKEFPKLWDELKNRLGLNDEDFLDKNEPEDDGEEFQREWKETGVLFSDLWDDLDNDNSRDKHKRNYSRNGFSSEPGQTKWGAKTRIYDELEKDAPVTYNVPELSLELLMKGMVKKEETKLRKRPKLITPIQEPLKEKVLNNYNVLPAVPVAKVDLKEEARVQRLEALELIQKNRLKLLLKEQEAKTTEESKKKKKADDGIAKPNALGLQVAPDQAEKLKKDIKKTQELIKEKEAIKKKQKMKMDQEALLEFTKNVNLEEDLDDDETEKLNLNEGGDSVGQDLVKDNASRNVKKLEEKEMMKNRRSSFLMKLKSNKKDKGDNASDTVNALPLKNLTGSNNELKAFGDAKNGKENEKNVEVEKAVEKVEEIDGKHYYIEYLKSDVVKYPLHPLFLDDNSTIDFSIAVNDKSNGMVFGRKAKMFEKEHALANGSLNALGRKGSISDSRNLSNLAKQKNLNAASTMLKKGRMDQFGKSSHFGKGDKAEEPNSATVTWSLFKAAMLKAQMGEGMESLEDDLKSVYEQDLSYKMKNPLYKPMSRNKNRVHINQKSSRPVTQHVGTLRATLDSSGGNHGTSKTDLLHPTDANHSASKPDLLHPNDASHSASKSDSLHPRSKKRTALSGDIGLSSIDIPVKNKHDHQGDETGYDGSDDDTQDLLDGVERPALKFHKLRLATGEGKVTHTHIKTLDGLDANEDSDQMVNQDATEVFNGESEKENHVAFDFDNKLLTVSQQKGSHSNLGSREKGSNSNLVSREKGSSSNIATPDVEDEIYYGLDTEAIEETVQKLETPKVIPRKKLLALQKATQQELITLLTYAPWFPTFKGKEINVNTIVDALISVLKSTVDDESKAEAALCIRYIMETFDSDFKEMKEFIVAAELDSLSQTTNSNFKIQIISNLAASKLATESVIVNLIVTLNDKDPDVVDAAKIALATFGISSKIELEEKMRFYHMFNECRIMTPAERKVHPLQPLINKLEDEKTLLQQLRRDKVERWLKTIDPRIEGRPFDRPRSCVVTFVPPVEKKVLLKASIKNKSYNKSRHHGVKLGALGLPMKK